MKIVIDIDEKDYQSIKNGHIPFSVLDVLMNGTPLSKNATNRDVIKNIFGKYFSIPLATTDEWLDAPYEGSDSE